MISTLVIIYAQSRMKIYTDNFYNTLVEELKELGKDGSLIDRIKFGQQLSISFIAEYT